MREGHRAFDAKDPGLARLHFTHAIGYIRRSGKRLELLPELIGMTGRCLQRQQRWAEALDHYHQAAREAKRQRLFAQQLRWAGKLATAHLDMGNPTTGIPLLELSIELGRRLLRKKLPGVIDELASQLGRLAYATDRDPDRAEELWREAFALLEETDDQASRFRAAFNYAGFLEQADRPRQAATYLEEALEIAGRANLDRAKVAEALPLLSRAYRSMKAFERGGDRLMAELPRLDDREVRKNLMRAAVNAYFDGSLWEKMKGVAGDLWRLLEAEGDPLAADIGARYAIACRETGDLDEASRVLEAAIPLAAGAGDATLEQKLRAELARVLFEQGRHDRAVQTYEALWNEGFLNRLIAMRYPEALLAVGRIADAKAACATYLASGADEADLAIPLARIADAERSGAIERWRNAAEQSRGSERALALERLLDLLPGPDPERLKVAEALARIAESVRENVSDLFSENAWRAASSLAGKFNGYLDTCLREDIAAGRHEDAVYELERFRSQLLVDVLSERANVWAGERRTLGEKSSFADRAHRAQYRYEALSAMDADWAERREAAVAADQSRERAFTAGRVMQFGRQIFGLQFPDNLSEHLKDAGIAADESLVFLRITPQGTLLWYRGADGRIVPDAVPGFTLEVAQRIDTQLRTEPDIAATLAELDQKLTTRLTAPLNTSGVKRAFVVGGTDAANLPFDHCDSMTQSGVEIGFLPTARALGFARAARCPTSDTLYIPSARERRRFARELLAAHASRAMVVIDPTKSLRYAELEGLSVAAAAAKYLDVEIVEKANASRQNVQSAVGGCGHLHLISHGRFDSANPYRTGMYMDPGQSPQSLWTVADVFGDVAAPAGRLAFLSGCETGTLRGNVVSEEISLPAAFVASGFASVVASRWAVDDLSAALFVTAFYRAWLPGKTTVAAALRGAAQWLRALSKTEAREYLAGVEAAARGVDPKLGRRMGRLARAARSDLTTRRALPFSDPRHWAAFYVVGDAAQVRRTT
jgi:CHAT domain-containing protein/tetratricopeptide (TPR) repeat protein